MTNFFIVDDEPIIHILYQKIFRRAKHTIVGDAYNGREAIELLSLMKQKPDIVIMDYRMPVKNGLVTTKELLQQYPDLKIVFVSADDSVKSEALEAGVTLFIVKPFDTDVLLEALKSLSNN